MSILTVLELKQAIKRTFMGDASAGNLIEAHDQSQRDRIAELEAEVTQLNNALESACEFRNDECPIDECCENMAYPESCEGKAGTHDTFVCKYSDESTMECWKKWYLGTLVDLNAEENNG